MGKSFTFVVFLLTGVLIAQVVCPRPPSTKKESKPETKQQKMDVDDSEKKVETETVPDGDDDVDGEDDEDATTDEDDNDQELSEDEEIEEPADEDEETEPTLPFLTCTVFKDNFACNAMCSILGSMYGAPVTSGVCGEEKDCECEVSPTATLEDYWNKKFLARNTLREILKDEDLSKKILEILKTPFKTAKQTVEDLKPLLSEKLLRNLRIKDAAAQKIFINEEEFDKKALRSYVAAKLKSSDPQPDNFGYKETLLDVLNNPDNEAIADYVINEIRQTKNKLLNNVVEEYAKERNIQLQQPDAESNEDETIIDLLDTAVINQLIKPPPRESSLKLTPLRSKSRTAPANPANKPSAKPTAAKSTENPEQPASPMNTSPNTPDKQSLQPAPPTPNPKTDDSRWTLQGFDKRQIDGIQTIDKCWEDSGSYKVCMYKSKYLTWLCWNNKKDGTTVEIKVSYKGDVEQTWTFENRDVTIQIQKTICLDKRTQFWSFPRSSLWYSRGVKTWRGPADPQSIEKYRGFMNAWCAYNDFFVGKDICLAYQF